ncbi:MAG: Uma2 family endonuclease [Desulfobacterales bacterium]
MEISVTGKIAVNRPSFPMFSYRELLEKMEETDDAGIVYPESDGEPMGETEIHVMVIIELCRTLRHFFRNHPDVYAISNMLMYYEKGNPGAYKVPDVMVVKGVEKHLRRIFRIWKEKAVPSVIFEITAKATASEDIAKTSLYASLGVGEYFLFDPLEEYLEKGFMGFRLDGLMYRPVIPEKDGSLFSEELGLILKREGNMLRLADPETGRLVPNVDEAVSMAEKEARRAKKAEDRAEEEARKSALLAAKLREMGIDPDLIAGSGMK